MGSFGREIKHIVFRLLAAKGFVLTVLLTLGLTLAATVCIFSLNWLLLAKPLPYPDQHRLVYVKGQSLKNNIVVRDDTHIYPVLMQLYDSVAEFDAAALISYNDNVISNLPDTPRMDMTYVSSEYFGLVDMPVALGRVFSVKEGVGSNEPVAVISYHAWQHYFNGAKDVLGKKIQIGNTRFSIVGVAGKQFEEPQLHGNTWKTHVWLPWDYNEMRLRSDRANNWSWVIDHIKLIARLNVSEVNTDKLSALSKKLTNRMANQHRLNNNEPAYRNFSIALQVQTLETKILGDSHVTALLMLAGALSLLCIAGSNITNLFFARGAQMQRNFAIRSALGANPLQIFKTLFYETLVIMLMAVVLAGLLAVPGMQLLVSLSADHFPRVSSLQLGWVEVGFLSISMFVLALFFSALVFRQINYRQLVSSFQGSGKGSGLQIAKNTRQTLILSQVLLAGLLLTSTLTLLHHSLTLWLTPQTVETQGRYLLRVNIRQSDESDDKKNGELVKRVIKQLPEHAAIEQVTHSNMWPYWGHGMMLTDFQGEHETFAFSGNGIDDQWLSFYGVKLLQGDNFSRAQISDGSSVLLINQSAAKRLVGNGQAVGKRLNLGSKVYTVVGIVEDIVLPGADIDPRVYYPILPFDNNLAIKTVAGQTLDRERLNKLLMAIDKRLYVSRLIDSDSYYMEKMARDRLIVGLSLAISLLALFLVGIGLYGILSYQIQLSRFELGVRMAIGAKPFDVFVYLFTETLKPAGVGLISGFFVGAGIFWAYRYSISELIADAERAWLLPTVVSVTFIISIILLTCYLPLRSVVVRPPIYALREQIAQ